MTRTCPDGHRSESEDYCDVCGLALDGDAAAGTPEPSEPSEQEPTAPDLPPVRTSGQECPNCAATNPPDALFCEACGYDYTTGTMPRPLESMLTLPEDSGSQAALAGQAGEAPDTSGEATEPEAPAAVEAPEGPAEAAEVPGQGDPSAAAAHGSTAAVLEAPWVAEVWIDPDWYQDQGSADPMPSPGLPTVVLLRHASSLIGRSSRSRGIAPEVDISGDPGVSRRHAQLTTDGSRWFVEDLGSANGTYVGAAAGGMPESPVPTGQRRELAAGEQVYLGAWSRLVIREAAEGEV
jgi:hypothetical protein